MLGTTAVQISARACKYHVCIAILVAALLPPLSNAQQSSARKNHAPAVASSSPLLHAEELIQSGQLDEAKNVINEQLLRDPSNVEAYNLLGIIFTNEKNYTEALDAFQQALKLNPNSTSTHNNLANLYVAQQKPDLAEKEFKRVLQIAPANRDANYNLGLLLLANGSPLPAIAHFQRVHPQTVETQFNLVRAFFAAGKSVQALQLARQLSAAHKSDVQLHFTLGDRASFCQTIPVR
jgi:Tfp pilus assembly protein PilF